MKNLLFVFIILSQKNCYPQPNMEPKAWRALQLDSANTAKDINYLTYDEKEIILYINLVRLYPKDFIKYELRYNKDSLKKLNWYEQSLYNTLQTMESVPALIFTDKLYNIAQCLANEQTISGNTGHRRSKKCEDKYSAAENCSYNKMDAIARIKQLLVDEGFSDVGHRKNILNVHYKKIGVKIATHPEYSYVTVIDFG